MEQVNDKVFFVPGDVCTLRQDLPNKPIMLVVRKKTISVKGDELGKFLLGIICRWFTSDGHMEESLFSTKDLIKL